MIDAIAKALAETRPEEKDGLFHAQWIVDVIAVAGALASAPGFDRGAFLAACGLAPPGPLAR